MADEYTIRRVTSAFKFGKKDSFPHEHPAGLSENQAITIAIDLNNGRDNKHCDFYVVFKDDEPYWSPENKEVTSSQ